MAVQLDQSMLVVNDDSCGLGYEALLYVQPHFADVKTAGLEVLFEQLLFFLLVHYLLEPFLFFG